MLGELLGAYRIESEIGAGGMGAVYRARVEGDDQRTAAGTVVAIKVLHPHLLDSRDGFRRFLREAEIGTRIRHTNVVRTLDVDASIVDGRQLNYLVMEYVEGQTLAALLREAGRLPERLCRHVGEQIANGLEAIHALGVVHRDIKPDNVLITPADEIKIMDLGVARLVDEALRLSQAGSFVGSLEYAAPEQFRGGGAELDERADLHALGLVLYELSTGFVTFSGDDVAAVIRSVLDEDPRRVGRRNPQLSAFFEEVVHKLLRKDPARRFASAAEVATVLREGERSAWWSQHSSSLRTETRRPLRRIRIPRETAIYGRGAEIARLDELYARVKRGDGQVVLVEGEAGIGKTRLIDEFVAGLRERGEDPNFLFGSYPPGGAATAAGAFSTAYREHFSGADLEVTLAGHVPASGVAAFAALLRGDALPEGAEKLGKDTLQMLFLSATRALAAERPTIVLIDDLHFTPEEGRALFAALAAGVPGHPVLLVGTTRPGVLPSAWTSSVDRLPQTSRIQLARLGAKDLTELLVDVFHSHRLAEELGFEIAAKSDGNPFFVFEIVQGLRDANFIERGEDGSWQTTGRLTEIEIPASVADLIQARIVDLPDEDKDLLELAACWGFEFDPLVVAEAAGVGRLPALKRLARIERAHRLVRSAGRSFVFDHHQVQEALYQGLPQPLREEYHAALAETVERMTGAGEGDARDVDCLVALQLCDHFLSANRGPRALRYLAGAFSHLDGGYLVAQAVRLAERALAVPELTGATRVKVLLEQARRLDTLGLRDAQHKIIQEAIRSADELEDAALRARARRLHGWYLLSSQRVADARPVLEEALQFAQLADDRRSEAEITGNLGSAFVRLGRHADALGCHRRHLQIATDEGFRAGMMTAHGNLAVSCRHAGDRPTAREHYRECIALARELGLRRDEAVATVNLALLLADEGMLAAAQERQREGLAVCREIGFRRGESAALEGIASGLVLTGRPDEALPLLGRALALDHELGASASRGNALLVRAAALEHLGRHEEATRDLDEALSIALELPSPPLVPPARVALARAALWAGDRDAALVHVDEALRACEAIDAAASEVLALALAALLREEAISAAVLALQKHAEAVGVVDNLESRFRLWQATRDPAHLREAQRLLEHLRRHAPEADRDRMVSGVPLHRDIAAAAATELD